MSEQGEFDTMDDMVRSVAAGNIKGVYSGSIEEQKGPFAGLAELFSKQGLLVLLFMALIFGMAYAGIDDTIILVTVIAAVIILRILSTHGGLPDTLVVTDDKVYLLTDAMYDKKTEKCSYESLDECNSGEVEKFFSLAKLNPMSSFSIDNIKINNKKFVMSKNGFLAKLFQKRKPEQHIVSFAEMKKLLHIKS